MKVNTQDNYFLPFISMTNSGPTLYVNSQYVHIYILLIVLYYEAVNQKEENIPHFL